MKATEKRVETNLNIYGVANVSQLKSVQDKRRQTFENKRTTLMFYQEPRINKIDGHTLSIYAIDKKIADNWLNEYHPFKAPRGNVLCLGLVKDSNVYCMMTFKKSRNPKYYAELSRMWMLPSYNVVNGYDILSSSASEFGIYNIVAYVNMSFENYKDYEKLGMKHIRDIQRTRWWVKESDIVSDASRRQKRLSENEMIFQGYVPVYDCGTRVYEV